METIENNKLIAEFMGIESYELRGYTMFVYEEDNHRTDVDLHYHKSWDWLMPVINKCYQEYMSKHIAEVVMTCDISKAYQVVVEFINEYNLNK